MDMKCTETHKDKTGPWLTMYVVDNECYSPRIEQSWDGIEQRQRGIRPATDNNAEVFVASVAKVILACNSYDADQAEIKRLRTLLSEVHDHAERYGGVPKSATLLWDRVRAALSHKEVKP